MILSKHTQIKVETLPARRAGKEGGVKFIIQHKADLNRYIYFFLILLNKLFEIMQPHHLFRSNSIALLVVNVVAVPKTLFSAGRCARRNELVHYRA
jgi:hypothetical protein